MAIAPAAIMRAADPARVPFIRFRAMDSSSNAPPITVRPRPISSQVIPPKSDNALAMIFNAAPTAIRPTLMVIVLFGSSLIAPTRIPKDPAIATRP